MTQVRGTLGFTDSRSFGLIGYRSGHSYALFRGFPSYAEVEESESDQRFRVMDLCFVDLDRISCWRTVGSIHLRHPTDVEQAAVEARIGPVRHANVYLLRPDSIEDYVIAGAVHWAEYDLSLTAPSPLVTEDDGFRKAHPPIGGPVQFADQPWTPYTFRQH